METTSPPKHQRVWVTTAEARETLRQLGLHPGQAAVAVAVAVAAGER